MTGGIADNGHRVTQDYEGAPDLDIKPADNTQFVQVCRLWAAHGTAVRGELHFDSTSWTAATRIVLELDGPNGSPLGSKTFTQGTAQGEALQATAAGTGWHTFRIRSADTPADHPQPSYRLRVSYQAPHQTMN